MKNWVAIAIMAVGCITVITCVALLMGHDNTLVTGATSAIVGIIAGFAAYFKGKSKASSQGQSGNKKTDSSG